MAPPIFLAIQSSESRSPPLDAQRLINAFVEKQQPGAKAQAPLFCRAGVDLFSLVGGDVRVRGFHVLNGELYAVAGTHFIGINLATGVTTFLGEIAAGETPVSMADNGTQLALVDGTDGWIYTTALGLVQIVDVNFHSADMVVFFDGYFVFNWAGTNKFFLSGLYDGMSYSGTDFASAESTSEPIVGLAQNLQLLFFFKTDVIEYWYDAGTADFPFARYAGGVIPFGCGSAFSIVRQDGALYFLGTDRVFYRLEGNRPLRVSTNGIEHRLSLESDLTLVTSCTWTWEGHKFIAVRMPEQGRTYVLDISDGLWHERDSIDAERTGERGPWRCWQAIEVPTDGRTFFGDAIEGFIGTENWDSFTEYGDTIIVSVTGSTLAEDRKRIFVSRFELDVQAGVGSAVDPGTDPQIRLQWSKDGGQTWGVLQQARSMGAIGEYGKRLRWMNQGSGYQMTPRLVLSDPVRRVLIAAHADISIGM